MAELPTGFHQEKTVIESRELFHEISFAEFRLIGAYRECEVGAWSIGLWTESV